MGKDLHGNGGESRRKSDSLFYAPATKHEEALKRDVEAARARHGNRINAEIGARCGVGAKTVYSWFESRGKIFDGDMIDAIVEVTGGAHYRDYLQRIASDGVGVDLDASAATMGQETAGVVELAARLNAQLADDLSDGDDTPGEVDAAEAAHQLAMIDMLTNKLERYGARLVRRANGEE